VDNISSVLRPVVLIQHESPPWSFITQTFFTGFLSLFKLWTWRWNISTCQHYASDSNAVGECVFNSFFSSKSNVSWAFLANHLTDHSETAAWCHDNTDWLLWYFLPALLYVCLLLLRYAIKITKWSSRSLFNQHFEAFNLKSSREFCLRGLLKCNHLWKWDFESKSEWVGALHSPFMFMSTVVQCMTTCQTEVVWTGDTGTPCIYHDK